MKFILNKHLNREHQEYILSLIASYTTEVWFDYFNVRTAMLEFTLTKKMNLGKIRLHNFRESRISGSCCHIVKKLSQDDWIKEYPAHTYFNEVQRSKDLMEMLDARNKTLFRKRMDRKYVSNYALLVRKL